MTKAEWAEATDIQLMLSHLWSECLPTIEATEALEKKLTAYHVACCRRIWKLLRAPESRNIVRHLEWSLAHQTTSDEIDAANYEAEVVELGFQYQLIPEELAWCREIELLSDDETIAQLLQSHSVRELLYLATQFVGHQGYTQSWGRETSSEYLPFHSCELLRQIMVTKEAAV